MPSQDVILNISAFYKKCKNQFVKIFNYDNKLRAVAEIFIKVKNYFSTKELSVFSPCMAGKRPTVE
jgi:hypothetical protein